VVIQNGAHVACNEALGVGLPCTASPSVGWPCAASLGCVSLQWFLLPPFAVQDFDTFHAALEGNSSYASSLSRSLSLVLDEFYANMRSVGVSAVTGEGMGEFFDAIGACAAEYDRFYKPELERRHQVGHSACLAMGPPLGSVPFLGFCRVLAAALRGTRPCEPCFASFLLIEINAAGRTAPGGLLGFFFV
jgi:Conserved hypothetical ATP binding protein